MKLHIAKFGGTSMGSVEAMQRAAPIVGADPHSRLVVVSATSGTTNRLLAAQDCAEAGDTNGLTDLLGGIQRRHEEMAEQLRLSSTGCHALYALYEESKAILRPGQRLSPAALDQLLSIGERLSSILFTQALCAAGIPAQTLDARTVLRTDSHFGKAEPNVRDTRELCERMALPLLASGTLLVTQGFIGTNAQGATTTLGRGGSDYSAALFSEALNAQECRIWTDVSGIYTMDPRVVPEAKVIPSVTFAEAAELANFGAKVLHPATLLPAVRAGIKVYVGNTFSPAEGGTWIHPELDERPLFRAVAMRERQTLITVTSMRMLNAQGFLARLFAILAQHGLSVDLVTTSEVSVALTIDGTSSGSGGRNITENVALLTALREFAEVRVEENLSLVALIGNRITATPGIALRCFQAVGPNNVRLICHGASAHNLCFLVDSAEAKAVVARLHEEFL